MRESGPDLVNHPISMNSHCSQTPIHQHKTVVSHGFYFRKSDGHWIKRFKCLSCNRTYSTATLHANYNQRRRDINRLLGDLIVSGVSQRRSARILRADPKTIVRRFRHLADLGRERHRKWQQVLSKAAHPFYAIQFDDLETAEHTKCKPLSVALAVEPHSRKILSYQVSRMPAKGLLAHVARKKYPKRPDERIYGWRRLCEELVPLVRETATFTSDENPHYPKFISEYFQLGHHVRHKGRKPSVAGQGELKKVIFDPLFSLNHTCAMLRANMNRLFRKTWCISKTVRGLEDHLALYVNYHNHTLTKGNELV